MMLDEQERAYLLSLQDSPVWQQILKKLSIAKPPTRYTPTRKDQNYDLWVYESGGLAATEAILSVLSLKEITLNQEDKHGRK